MLPKVSNYLLYPHNLSVAIVFLQVDIIADHTSFQKMKENPATNMSDLDYMKYKQKGTSFQRKGIVGGWKDHFSKDQSEYLEHRVQEKLSGTGLTFEYEI